MVEFEVTEVKRVHSTVSVEFEVKVRRVLSGVLGVFSGMEDGVKKWRNLIHSWFSARFLYLCHDEGLSYTRHEFSRALSPSFSSLLRQFGNPYPTTT